MGSRGTASRHTRSSDMHGLHANEHPTHSPCQKRLTHAALARYGQPGEFKTQLEWAVLSGLLPGITAKLCHECHHTNLRYTKHMCVRHTRLGKMNFEYMEEELLVSSHTDFFRNTHTKNKQTVVVSLLQELTALRSSRKQQVCCECSCRKCFSFSFGRACMILKTILFTAQLLSMCTLHTVFPGPVLLPHMHKCITVT